jgi:K+:H+ antiporter
MPSPMILLAQIAVIVCLSRAMRWTFAACGQPGVVGEMLAGLLLGPSCFGWIAPRASDALFAPGSLDPLDTLSQIGLVLFMFIVGLRLRAHPLGADRKVAVAVSAASIILPFGLGAWLASAVHHRLAPADIELLPFALFVGATMRSPPFPYSRASSAITGC